jgi:hypothetical protein
LLIVADHGASSPVVKPFSSEFDVGTSPDDRTSNSSRGEVGVLGDPNDMVKRSREDVAPKWQNSIICGFHSFIGAVLMKWRNKFDPWAQSMLVGSSRSVHTAQRLCGFNVIGCGIAITPTAPGSGWAVLKIERDRQSRTDHIPFSMKRFFLQYFLDVASE